MKEQAQRPRRWVRAKTDQWTHVGLLATVTTVVAVLAIAGLRGSPLSGHSTMSAATPAITPGDYVTFHCPGGAIAVNGTPTCHDQVAVKLDLGSGNFYVIIQATPDASHGFTKGWTSSGDACFGSLNPCNTASTNNPETVWGYCAPTSTCAGDVWGAFFQTKFLSGYSSGTFHGTGWSENFQFTVPSGVSHTVLFWSVTDSVSLVINSFPSGLTNVASFGSPSGSTNLNRVAEGALSAGTYSVDLSSGGGWVNSATIGVYDVYNDSGFTFDTPPLTAQEATTLTMPSGADIYLGAEITGGAYGITSNSLTTVNEYAIAQDGYETGLIGSQTSNAFSFTYSTQPAMYGILAIGVYPP